MTIFFRAFIATAIATGIALRVTAQDAPASPAPATEKKAEPRKATAAKPAARPAANAEAKPDPVLHPEPGVTKQNNVNIRGQAKINSEVIAHLQKSDPVTILEEVTIKKPKQDEPARWYRIALPTNVAVWVNTSFIEDGKVKPRRLNMRGGPGENYSILGRLDRGTPVKTLDTKGEWTKIEPTTNAFGFVAAHLIERTPAPAIVAAPPKRETPAPTPPPTVAEVPQTTPPVTPTEPVTTPPATPPAPATAAPATPVPAPVITPAPAETPETPVEKVKKVVSREGILKGSVSIQAPTYFELRSLDTGKTINYVFSPSTNLVLKQYRGRRIIVSGEELLDERWQNTPVLVVDALQTVE